MNMIKLCGYDGYQIVVMFGSEIYYNNNVYRISFCLYFDGLILLIAKCEYNCSTMDTNLFFAPMRHIIDTFSYKCITKEIAKENIKIILYYLSQLLPKEMCSIKRLKYIAEAICEIKL